jgi:hypothetical protein
MVLSRAVQTTILATGCALALITAALGDHAKLARRRGGVSTGGLMQ